VEIDNFLSKYPQTSFLDTAFVDMSGNLRGKRLPIEDIRKPWNGSVLLPYSVHILTATGETSDAGGYGVSDGDPDGVGRPLAGTLVPVTWTPTAGAQVLMELCQRDGSIYEFDPRQILQKVLERLLKLGVRPVVAFELEFYLFEPGRDAGGAPVLARSIDQSATDRRVDVYAFEPLDANYSFFDTVRRCAAQQGIDSSVATSEYATGQFEINLNHDTDVMRLADQCVMFRRLVKGVAMAHDMRASFMAKPLANSSGSGMHIHLSLIDENNNNIFSTGNEPDDNVPLKNAVAGVLESMSESVALFAPNINAYRRFQPGNYVPMAPSWGINNRVVACRIPAGEKAARRLEHRVASADACPHLVLAAVLAGVEHGLRNGLEPPLPIDKPGQNRESELQSFPATTSAALRALESSSLLAESIGQEYLTLYAETRRYESREFFSQPSEREYEWYL